MQVGRDRASRACPRMKMCGGISLDRCSRGHVAGAARHIPVVGQTPNRNFCGAGECRTMHSIGLPKPTSTSTAASFTSRLLPAISRCQRTRILDWVRASARAVSTYYGRFPVKSLKLLLVPVDGRRVRGGTTWGYRGAAIRVLLGRDSSEEDLRRDWIMVHEMVHLALPDMEQRYDWLSEGLAVYIEPIARVQAGDLAAQDVWQAMMRDMPKGSAAGRRSGTRQYRQLGPEVLGRRHVLPAGRYRNSQADIQPAWPARCDARRHRGRRQS